MAKFHFSLHAVLQQREMVERQRQRELAEQLAALNALQSRLDAMTVSAQRAVDDLRDNHLVGRLDLAFLAAHRRFLNATSRQAAGVMQQIAVQSQKVEAARALLSEAAKQRRLIEKLREKQFERWKLEQAARETAETDEVGMQLAHRAP